MGTSFDREGARRVSRAVRRLERTPLLQRHLRRRNHTPQRKGFTALRVKFTADLATGGSAAANRMDWDAAESEWVEGDPDADPTVAIEVFDDGLNDTAKSGQQGWVWFDRASKRYYVLRLQKTETTVVTKFCCSDDEEDPTATACEITVWMEGNFTIDTECCAPPDEEEEEPPP